MTEKTFTEVLIRACELDRAGSRDGHYRTTTLRPQDGSGQNTVDIDVAHFTPDLDVKRIRSTFFLNPGGNPIPRMSDLVIDRLCELHEQIDEWAFADEFAE